VPSSTPSGYYAATVTVLDGSTPIATLPVVLKVWAFTLPSTASLKSAFGMSWDGFCVQAYGGYNGCSAYPGSGGSSDTAVELTHIAQADLLLDHRMSISGVVYVGPPAGTWAHFDATYGPLLNGTAGTQLPGAKLTALQFIPPAADDLAAPVIRDWVSHFTAAGWLGPLFHYTCDEPPNGCSWANALSMVATVHNASPSMKSLVTTDLASATQHGLVPDLNIIVPTVDHMEPQGGTNQRSTYNSFLTGANKHLWWYQACSEHGSCSNGVVGPASATWPSYMIDATPVRNRVFQWLAFIDGIESELYYEIDYCWVTALCGPNSNANQPWTSVYAFGGNGDGTLIYPGLTSIIGGTTPIPLPSVRLKHIRDGMEDYEYLIALSQAGDDAFARATAATFITNAYTFNNDPQALTNAREALGDRLHRMTLPSCSEAGVCAHDFNGDGLSDIAWRDTSGNLAIWLMNAGQILSAGSLGLVPTTWSIVGQRDFDGDGNYDLLWRDSGGNTAIWLMNGMQMASSAGLGNMANASVIATRDFDGDGKADILWRDTTGNVTMWLMNGTQIASTAAIGNVASTWSVVGTGDFNGDGMGDLLWRDAGGNLGMWLMNGARISSAASLGNVPSPWSVVGTGDFNGDGMTDVLWQDSSGNTAIWFMNGAQVASSAGLGTVPPPWAVAATGDYDGNGVSDLLWRDTGGNTAIWFMNGGQIASSAFLGTILSAWTVQSVNAD
jgi:hypothetical protein